MLRGGSWYNNPENCRSANRNRNTPHNRNNNIGFRVLRVPPCTLQRQSRWMGIH
ncbi:MAG: SUMF1/EgtB/PvdO family nonheme iron enzyme [Leptolyngbyaceae cyanobacterium RU_5_1]|nr:SUMF1/EgtB/PvdO family nonheme iron enzyme [Leptolyngbyaceae cyanobacterium RU_5_1]